MKKNGDYLKKKSKRHKWLAAGAFLAAFLICVFFLTRCGSKVPRLAEKMEVVPSQAIEPNAATQAYPSTPDAAASAISPSQSSGQGTSVPEMGGKQEEVKTALAGGAQTEKAPPTISPPADSPMGKNYSNLNDKEIPGAGSLSSQSAAGKPKVEGEAIENKQGERFEPEGTVEVEAAEVITKEESPGGIRADLETNFKEEVIPIDQAPMCPGGPSTGGTVAEAEEPSGRNFNDPITRMSFVLVQGGCFKMGSDMGGSEEKPVHKVCVDDFYMGAYEVTQAQYEWIMGHNPSYYQECDSPVESVSWEDAQTFLQKLNRQSGREYRLPSEAEWEYAARSGLRLEAEVKANEYALGEYAWYVKYAGNQDDNTKNGPNGWGIYGMTGNVWEWVSDWYGAHYYSRSPRTNPQGPSSGSSRVIRSGSGVRSENQFTTRYGYAPGERQNYLGFRVAFSKTLSQVALGDK